MEYVGALDLSQLLDLSRREIFAMAVQVMSAVAYMHEKGCVHRDLKPANIVVASRQPSFICKVADFGESSDMPGLKTSRGSPRYQAPEVDQPPYSAAVDIWSCGVFFTELWYEWHLDFICALSLPGRDTCLPDTLGGPGNKPAKSEALKKLEWTMLLKLEWLDFARQNLDREVREGCHMSTLILHMLELNPDERWKAEVCESYLRTIAGTLAMGDVVQPSQAASGSTPYKRVRITDMDKLSDTSPTIRSHSESEDTEAESRLVLIIPCCLHLY